MNIVCTSKKEQIASFYDEMANSYIYAFGRPPWNERSKCRAEYLIDRQNCVGKLSQLAVGQFCVDCGRTPNEPAYSVGECQQAFDALLAKGAVFYIESELESFVFATIGILRDSTTLVDDKYDDEVMATAIDDIIGSDLFVWLEESFANLSLRPSGNMKNRYAAVLALASQLGCERIATRTINPKVISATCRDFPQAKLYLPNEEYQTEFNNGLEIFRSTSVGTIPDRRALLVWNTPPNDFSMSPESGRTGII